VTLMTRPVPVLLLAIIVCGLDVYGAMALAEPLSAALADWSPAGQETLFALLLYGILAAVAMLGRWFARDTVDSGARPGMLPWLGLGVLLGVGGLVLALGDAVLAGVVVRGTAGLGIATLLLGTLVVIGQSASEELFFRGWLQPVLARAWGPAAAIGVTAIAFALLHVAGGTRTPLTLVNLMLGGLLFGLLAWRSTGLAAPIGAHAGWNWAEAILFGLDPNPGVGGFGAIHDLDLLGAARWGGSSEGLNASLAMTLVLAALILPLAVRLPFRRRPAPAA